MPLYSANAIVLRRRDFEETDKLLVLFTRELGKLPAIAKGARRPQSRLVGASEPFVYARLQLATGRNLDIVTEASIKHPFAGLRASAVKIQCGMRLLEFADAMLDERQPSPELFDLLLSSLYLLEARHHEPTVTRRFEIQALDLSGYAPETKRCVICRAIRPDGSAAAFSSTLGGIVCQRCRAGHEGLIPAHGEVLSAMESLRVLPAHQIDSFEIGAEDARLLGRLLEAHSQSHLEHQFKTSGSLTAG